MTNCEECCFWEKNIKDPPFVLGECRRNAPSHKDFKSWPETSKNDWCGEGLKGPIYQG